MSIGTRIVLEGEKEYRKAISDVNSSMRVLKSELKAVSAEFDGNANSVDALGKKNEILNKQQKEQEKVIKLLRGALESATKEFGENSKQAQNWQIKLNNAQAQLSKLNKEIDSNDKHLKEAKSSTDKTAKSIDEFGKEVKEAGNETLKTGDIIKANLTSAAVIAGVQALGRAIKDVSKAMINIVKDTANYADDILTMSAQTGVATDTLQELNYMAELTDVSLETITKSMQRNIRGMQNAQKGTKDYTDAYKSLGVAVTDANGQLRDSGTVFWEAIEAFGEMTNETERDAIAMRLFGRSAQELNPLIKIGREEIARFSQEARDMGAVMSTETLESLVETSDELQRMYQQIAITKRELGTDLAPEMTKAFGKITEKLSEVDDEFAKFAGGALEDVVDGFVWMVDNADKIKAGLKGIGAAIITKKVADGVLHAVNAYRTLTTATQTATTAQLAFNTASKANIYVALASAIVGAAYALDSFISSTKNATRETVKMDEETKRLIESSERLTKLIKDRANAWEDEQRSIEANYGTAKILSDRLYELADKEQKTNAEKQEMISLVEQLNRLIPDLNLNIGEQTGLLTKQKDEIGEVIDSFKELALTRAAEDTYTELLKSRIDAEIQLNNLVEERNRLEEELDYEGLREKATRYLELRGKGYIWLNKEEKKFLKDNAGVFDSLEKASDKLEPYRRQIRELDKELDRLSKTTEGVESFISESFMSSSTYLDGFTAKYQKYLDEQTQAEVGTLQDRQKKISKIYEQTSKELDKQLKAEERAFAKSQQKRVEEVQKAQEKELKEVEKTHKVRLDLLNEEYLQKIKTVDEDRYKELKKVQDEIDAIDNQQEAEDRALKAREDAEKKAELQARVESAKTIEERMDAQKELQKHEERVAKERLKEERGLQKDILKHQKETINKGFDEKVKAIEAEQKKEQEKLAEQLKNEKDAVAEKYKLRAEALKEEQELEKDALRDRQTEYKDYLREQKELAIANSKEIYEEDLAKFKLNQALKYKDAVSSDAQMKKAIQEYAYKSMQPGRERTAILSTNDLNEMLKYYNPSSAINSSVPQAQSIDYSLIETAMTNAVKKLNLSVVISNKKMGEIIDENIRRNLRR